MSPLQLLIVVVLGVVPGGMSGRTTPSPPPPHTLEEAAHRMEMILNNTRSRENYIRCFMDRGICNKDASSIKRILTDALTTNCSNCTQIQRMGVEKLFQYLQSHQPETWVSLTDKYKNGGGGGTNGEKNHHHHDDDDDDDDDEVGEGKTGKKQKKKKEGGDGKNKNQASDGSAMKHNGTTVSTTEINLLF